jgi:ubiquinone biosynthesis protein COQ9
MKEKAFKACLKIIERDGWKAFSFAKAAQESGIPLEVFHKHFLTPSDVMVHLFRKIDEKVLKTPGLLSENLSPKDVLFEILMARFDAALPYKPVIKSFWQDWILVPNDAPAFACQGFSSMTWMLEAANLSPRGLTGLLRVQGLLALYLLTLRTWLTDDSSDLGKTMAFLDNGLSKLEKMAGLLNFHF